MMALLPISVVFVIFSYSISSVNSKAINDLLTQDSMKRYFSVSSIEEVPEYEIINPISNSRRRRSINGIEYPNKHEVKFTAFGEDYHLKLWKNTKLFRPGIFAEYLQQNGTVIKKPIVKHCHYFGELASHNKSRAAISTCSGLSGIFSHGDIDVYIQPLQKDHADKMRRRRSNLEHPHVIYRRSAGDLPNKETDETREMKQHVCGNDERYYHDANNENEWASPVPHAETEKQDATRTKRQASTRTRYLEVLVVADYPMRLYHGDNVDEYVLTLMNIAASRYADPSFGTYLQIYITKFIIADNPSSITYQTPLGGTASVSVSADAGSVLPQFCQFQHMINPASDSDPVHWDNALLISREDLHLYGNRNLLGIARLWGTCSDINKCSMNEESGLASALTITHEIGHTLGINHDGGQCRDGINIMASTRAAGPDSYIWSECSRNQANVFFENTYSECTQDVPSSNHPDTIQTITNDLPGKRYDADTQCQLTFGSSYVECIRDPIPGYDDCAYLWCRSPSGQCFGAGSAKMDGTYCGLNQICLMGVCTYDDNNAFVPVDGGWSDYDPNFSTCSRTCGGGVQFRRRYCNNPAPENGGAQCAGDDKLMQICNSQPCTTTQEDFRDEQCASTNNQVFNNQYLQWTGFTLNREGDGLCDFSCQSSNTVTRRGTHFIDGTRCDVHQPNSDKYCVEGKCIEFGCDGVPNSPAEFDKCGECGGTGSTCNMQSGTVSQTPSSIGTLFNILTIQSGATSIKINNLNRNSHMVVKVNGQFVIGDGSTRGTSMEYKYGTQSFYYTQNPESITIPGRTTTNVEIEVYMYRQENTYVTWEYYIQNGGNPIGPEPDVYTYRWLTKNEFTECSASCGQGTRSRIVACFRNDNVQVDDSYCNGQSRPIQSQICYIQNCPPVEPEVPTYRWAVTDEFTPCTATCGQGTRSRVVVCYRNDNVEVDDAYCNGQTRPEHNEICNLGNCPEVPFYRWVVTDEFTPCTTTCGPGTRTKIIICLRRDDVEVNTYYCSSVQERPTEETETCNLGECLPEVLTYEWVVTDQYTECSATCGQGVRTKIIECLRNDGETVHGTYCNNQPRPSGVAEVCNIRDCGTTYQWFTKNGFTECSTTCGEGTRSKIIVCLRNDGVEFADSYCNDQERPREITEICNENDCTPNGIIGTYVTGAFGQCSVTCGEGIRSRQIYCVTQTIYGFSITDESNCNQNEKPNEQEPCNNEPCPDKQGVWIFGQWTPCSKSCGGGVRSRPVYCKQSTTSNIFLIDSQCSSDKPNTQESCNVEACPIPVPSEPTGVCNRLLTDSSSKVVVGNTNGEYCNITIAAPINQRIVLRFGKVDVNCQEGGNFIIKDGANVYTVCSHLTNREWPRSSSNVMEVAAITTQDSQGYELEFTFETVNYQTDGCDSLKTSESGTITSPGYPSTYPANTDCYNIIVAPPGKRISISFTEFKLEFHPRCGYDSVRIRDFESFYTVFYCSYRQPFTWVSLTNKVQLHFHSDPGLEESGFYATYTFV